MSILRHNIVLIQKDRRKALNKPLRWHLGEVFRSLAQQRESDIEEGHLMADHVHMLISILPKYSVAQFKPPANPEVMSWAYRTEVATRRHFTFRILSVWGGVTTIGALCRGTQHDIRQSRLSAPPSV